MGVVGLLYDLFTGTRSPYKPTYKAPVRPVSQWTDDERKYVKAANLSYVLADEGRGREPQLPRKEFKELNPEELDAYRQHLSKTSIAPAVTKDKTAVARYPFKPPTKEGDITSGSRY